MSWTVLFTSPSAGHGWCSRSCPARARSVLQGFGAGYTDGHCGCEGVEEHSCVSWWLQVLPPPGRLHFPSAGHRWGVCSAWGSALAVGWSRCREPLGMQSWWCPHRPALRQHSHVLQPPSRRRDAFPADGPVWVLAASSAGSIRQELGTRG